MRNDRPVKVLLAESGTTLGGTERVVWEIATRLPASRFEVAVWLSDSPGVDELAASLTARDIAVSRVREVDSRWDVRGMMRTFGALRRHRPDLLHIHHVWPAADRYLPAIARAAGVPHVVVTEHIVGRSHSVAQRALKRRELDQADAVTTVCGAVADSLVRDYGVDRSRLRVVPNGAELVDEDEEWPAARRLRDEFGAGQFRPLWVCAGRLEEQKGHAVLLDALAELKRKNLDFVTVIAGEGTLRQALERRAEKLALGRTVRFIGQIDAIGPLLLAADACILPSLWEGLPLTLLEALARGRPVVATNVGGIPEVIEDGTTGRMVPANDVAALADALEEFHRRPGDAKALGSAGAARVRSDFTWPHVVERFELVYDEVLGLASFAPESGAGAGARR